MILDDGNGDRADAYRLLADLYTRPPDAAKLATLREDLELTSTEDESAVLEDFNRLFSYLGGSVPPIESLNDADNAAAAETLTGFYAEAGLTFAEEYQLVPDHLALEFLFMSYLIETRNLDLQEQFLEGHLMNWVPDFCDRVKDEARTVFYREAASLTGQFLEREYENFG